MLNINGKTNICIIIGIIVLVLLSSCSQHKIKEPSDTMTVRILLSQTEGSSSKTVGIPNGDDGYPIIAGAVAYRVILGNETQTTTESQVSFENIKVGKTNLTV